MEKDEGDSEEIRSKRARTIRASMIKVTLNEVEMVTIGIMMAINDVVLKAITNFNCLVEDDGDHLSMGWSMLHLLMFF